MPLRPAKSWGWGAARRLLLIVAGFYCLALLGLFAFQRSVMYLPTHSYNEPVAANASPFKEVAVTTEDGINIREWYAPATSRRTTLVYFHGNADSLASTATIALPYVGKGFGMMLVEYRGYSGNDGKPTEEGLYNDARAAIRSLVGSGVPLGDIVLFGHSLGTGIAVQMASEFQVRGLVLFAPFLSTVDVAKARYPIFPVSALTKDRYENYRKIGDIHAPVFITHGTSDRTVNVSQGKNLFALANEPKQLLLLPDIGHSDLFDDAYGPLVTWLEALE